MIIVCFISFLMIFQLEACYFNPVELGPYHLLLDVFSEGDQPVLHKLLENGQKERKRKANQQDVPVAKRPKFNGSPSNDIPINRIEQRCGKEYLESEKLAIERLLAVNDFRNMVNRILHIAINYIMKDGRPMQSKKPSTQLIKTAATLIIVPSFQNLPSHVKTTISDYDDKELKSLIASVVTSK